MAVGDGPRLNNGYEYNAKDGVTTNLNGGTTRVSNNSTYEKAKLASCEKNAKTLKVVGIVFISLALAGVLIGIVLGLFQIDFDYIGEWLLWFLLDTFIDILTALPSVIIGIVLLVLSRIKYKKARELRDKLGNNSGVF